MTAPGFVAAAPAHAQRVGEDALAGADDAFGTTVGQESTGIYTDQDTRGFSPVKAGNARIDGVYYDPVGPITGRLREGTSIRIGLAAQEFPFIAPTGIADYRFRAFPEETGASFSLAQATEGRSAYEFDLRLPVISGKIGITGGLGMSIHDQSDGSQQRTCGLTFRPFFRSGAVEIVPYIAMTRMVRNVAHPLYIIGGAEIPALPPKGRYLGQRWAVGRQRGTQTGVTFRAALPGDLALRGGLFRAAGPRLANFTEVFGFTSASLPLSRRIFADPYQDIHSTSGEALLAWQGESGAIKHRVFAGYRGRNRYTESGGSASVTLAPVALGQNDQVARPALAFARVNRSRVRQSSLMLGYIGKAAGMGLVNFGVQRAAYRAVARSGLTGAVSPSRTKTWLYNAMLAADLSSAVTLYAATERGLEDSGTAPDSAANRNEQLPATIATQYEGGVRLKALGLQMVVSAFQVTKPYFSFDAANAYVASGTVRMRGLEGSVSGKIGERLTLVAGGLLLRPQVSGTARAQGMVGRLPAGTPSANVRIDASWRSDLPGALTPTATFNYTGRRAVTARPLAAFGGSQLMLPGAATLDLGLRSQFRLGKVPASLRLLVQNVCDKAEWKVASANTLYPEDRRRAILTLAADF